MALAGASVGAVRALNDSRTRRDLILFNADFFYPAALYHDRFVDDLPLNGFQFSAATFAVPDVAGFFAVRATVGSTPKAMVAWVAVLGGIVVVSGWATGRAVLPANARRWLPGVLLGGSAIYLADLGLRLFATDAVELLRPLSHNGALAGTLLAFAFGVGMFRSRTVTPLMACVFGMMAVCAGMMASDRWFGFWFAAPFGVAVAGTWAMRTPADGGPTIGRSAGVLLTIAVGCLIGLGVLTVVLRSHGDAAYLYWKGLPERSRLVLRVAVLVVRTLNEVRVGNVLVIAGVSWWAASGGVVLAAMARRLTGWGPAVSPWLLLYCLMSLASAGFGTVVFLVTELATILDREHSWNEYCRYFTGPLGLGLFGWAMALAGLAGSGWRWGRVVVAGGVSVVAVGLAVGSVVVPRDGAEDVLDYYPADVRAIDTACDRRGVHRGLGGYWRAKRITYLSRSGVRIDQAVDFDEVPLGITAFHWLNNAHGYWAGPGHDGGYRFLLARDDPMFALGGRVEEVYRVFGQPAEAISVGDGCVLMVYDRPSDDRVRRFAEVDPALVDLRAKLAPDG